MLILLGALFGDPHFITLDSVEYTFNGYGEYTILNANNAEFLLQGRMQPLPDGQGVKSPATGFTAFAMMQTGSNRIQVSDDEKLAGRGVEKISSTQTRCQGRRRPWQRTSLNDVQDMKSRIVAPLKASCIYVSQERYLGVL